MLCRVSLDEIPGQARAVVRLRGPDTRRFLQGSVSGDVERLDASHAVVAALLTVKGKLVSELIVLPPVGDAYDVLVPRAEADAVASAFDSHIVMDDVSVARVDDVVVAIAFDDDGDELHIEPTSVRVVESRHPLPAQLVIGARADVDAALAGARSIDADEFHRARIESATPGWGAELQPGFFPPEVGFVYAVSFDKGCFMGQEPIARIHARGQVNRVMVRVVLDRYTSAPSSLAHDGHDGAGTLTTCVGELSGAAGLAIVRRGVAQPGTLLHTADGIAARVVSGPLGDDPGVPGKRA